MKWMRGRKTEKQPWDNQGENSTLVRKEESEPWKTSCPLCLPFPVLGYLHITITCLRISASLWSC